MRLTNAESNMDGGSNSHTPSKGKSQCDPSKPSPIPNSVIGAGGRGLCISSAEADRSASACVSTSRVNTPQRGRGRGRARGGKPGGTPRRRRRRSSSSRGNTPLEFRRGSTNARKRARVVDLPSVCGVRGLAPQPAVNDKGSEAAKQGDANEECRTRQGDGEKGKESHEEEGSDLESLELTEEEKRWLASEALCERGARETPTEDDELDEPPRLLNTAGAIGSNRRGGESSDGGCALCHGRQVVNVKQVASGDVEKEVGYETAKGRTETEASGSHSTTSERVGCEQATIMSLWGRTREESAGREVCPTQSYCCPYCCSCKVSSPSASAPPADRPRRCLGVDVGNAPVYIVAPLVHEGIGLEESIEAARRHPASLREARIWVRDRLSSQIEMMHMTHAQAQSEEQCRQDRQLREDKEKRDIQDGNLNVLFKLDHLWMVSFVGANDVGQGDPLSEQESVKSTNGAGTQMITNVQNRSVVHQFTRKWIMGEDSRRLQMFALLTLKKKSLKWYGTNKGTQTYFKKLKSHLMAGCAALAGSTDNDSDGLCNVLSTWIQFQIKALESALFLMPAQAGGMPSLFSEGIPRIRHTHKAQPEDSIPVLADGTCEKVIQTRESPLTKRVQLQRRKSASLEKKLECESLLNDWAEKFDNADGEYFSEDESESPDEGKYEGVVCFAVKRTHTIPDESNIVVVD